MLNTIRGWFKPELTDPADIRELNKTLDLQEINLDSMNGYEFAKDILTAGDSVEIGKIHLNKIPADPDFGKQFLVTTGTLWSNSTKIEENIKNKLDKGPGLLANNARELEEQVEKFYLEKEISTTIYNSVNTFTLPTSLDPDFKFINVYVGTSSQREIKKVKIKYDEKGLFYAINGRGTSGQEFVEFKFNGDTEFEIVSRVLDGTSQVDVIKIYQSNL